jgi:hypothetical protein
MAKLALGMLALGAVLALLVLVAGSIPPQAAPSGRAALGAKAAAQAAERRANSVRTSEATSVPKRSIERSTSR